MADTHHTTNQTSWDWKMWGRDAAERAAKTFLQGYMLFWFATAGIIIGDTPAEVPNVDAFDTLFTVDNLKAGGLALAFSLFTSWVSKPVGNRSNASLTR